MAGFKQLLLDMRPVTFLSFDGEQVNRETKQIEDGIIIDESGNMDGIITQEDNNFVGYWAGIESMVPLDHFDQHSIRFCPTGANKAAEDAGLSRYPKAMISVQNNVAYDFSKKEFTYSFLINHGSIYFDEDTWNLPSYTDVIFHHDGILTFTQTTNRHSGSRTEIKLWPFGVIYSASGYLIDKALNDRGNWIVMRFKNFRFDLFVDGELVFSRDISSLVDSAGFTLDSKSKILTIGGMPTNYNANLWSDRCCRPYNIDAFAVYNRGLSDLELAKLFRRIWDYDTMVLIDEPDNFLRFDDDNLSKGYIINRSDNSSRRIYIMGGTKNVTIRRTGMVQGTRSMFFSNGANLKTQNASDEFLPLEKDYTFEFCFKTTDSNRGILFHQGKVLPPFEQMTVWFNSTNGIRNTGAIEITLSADDKIQVPGILTYGDWHHIIVRKKGDYYDVWVDGMKKITSFHHVAEANGYSTGVCFLSAPCNSDYIAAELSTAIFYPRSLSDMKILTRTKYDSVYRIRGTVTLMGNPTDAVVRVYSHESGVLLGETNSNPLTGVYVLDLLSNEKVDLFVFKRDDVTVKFRSYGFIVPYEIDDNPYNL